jgi:hypothetical protein
MRHGAKVCPNGLQFAVKHAMLRCLVAMLAFWSAFLLAADSLTPAQQRLRACNTQAKEKGLSGAARSHYITDCVSGRPNGRPLTPIQARNETCKKEADRRGLDGAERRGFMGNCTKPDRVKGETPQQVNVENCNRRAEARGLAGDDRKRFIAGCLDGSKVTVDG